jgi:DNA-binding MarR family transcriptional regulator
VLSHLWRKDGLHQSELAVCTNRNRANVTRIIDILEREDIVSRQDDSADRRVFRIYLTAKGQALKEGAATCAAQAIRDALHGLSEDEIATCTRVLLKLTANVG